MGCRTGRGDLYYIKYAKEILRDGVVEPQPPSFLRLAQTLHAWLMATFTSERGRNTADNRDEYQRLD